MQFAHILGLIMGHCNFSACLTQLCAIKIGQKFPNLATESEPLELSWEIEILNQAFFWNFLSRIAVPGGSLSFARLGNFWPILMAQSCVKHAEKLQWPIISPKICAKKIG